MFSPARLRHERCQRLLPRELLAVLAGCSYDAIASYELGRRTPSSGTIARLAHALKVDVADLCDDVRHVDWDELDARLHAYYGNDQP